MTLFCDAPIDWSATGSMLGAIGTWAAAIAATVVAVFLYKKGKAAEIEQRAFEIKLAEREVFNNLYQARLNIYNNFIKTHEMLISKDYDRLVGIGYWQYSLKKAESFILHKHNLCVALNDARMLFRDDENIVTSLNNIYLESANLTDLCLEHAEKIHAELLENMQKSKQPQQVAVDKLTLLATNQYEKLNENCKEILEKIEKSEVKIRELLSNENFDIYFEKYFYQSDIK